MNIETNDNIENSDICLYHGIRFDAINRLESIFKTGFILPGNKINDKFISYDGTTKYLYINIDSDENCNRGKYVSVMPYEDDLEFDVFIRKNIFFAIKGSIKAHKTKYISYDEYCEQKNKNESGIYYSYAHHEYFVENGISLDDIVYIGIDPISFQGDYKKTVDEIIKLINFYKINIPLIDENTNSEIYRLGSKRLIKKFSLICSY